MEDDRDLLQVPRTTPANDRMAKFLKWVALLGGLALCGWGIATVLGD